MDLDSDYDLIIYEPDTDLDSSVSGAYMRSLKKILLFQI